MDIRLINQELGNLKYKAYQPKKIFRRKRLALQRQKENASLALT
jgi:hypothetical protein